MRRDYRIVIATRDSARWLTSLLFWYRERDLDPLFIIDARTKDKTRELVSEYGFKFKEFLPHGDFPEAGMLEFGAQQSDTDWILRLDDDELPNENLLRWVEDVGVRSKNQCWFIARRELFLDNNHIYYSRSIGKYPLAKYADKLHPMARLYHRGRVKFLEEIHTTGLQDISLYDFAPQENFLIHFNCLLHPFQTRLAKLRSYEAISPGLNWGLADEYLPELFSLDFHNAADDGLEEFSVFLKKINQPNRLISIDNEQSVYIIRHVKDRAHALLRNTYRCRLVEGEKVKHYSADDVSWIADVPKLFRRPLVRLLNSLARSGLNNYVMTLWNYCEVYRL